MNRLPAHAQGFAINFARRVAASLSASTSDIAPVHLASGVSLRNGRAVLVIPAADYDGMTDGMFHMIGQNAAGNPPALMRLLEVLTAVVSCEHDPARVATLRRHAGLVLADAEQDITTQADLADVRGPMPTSMRCGCTVPSRRSARSRADRLAAPAASMIWKSENASMHLFPVDFPALQLVKTPHKAELVRQRGAG